MGCRSSKSYGQDTSHSSKTDAATNTVNASMVRDNERIKEIWSSIDIQQATCRAFLEILETKPIIKSNFKLENVSPETLGDNEIVVKHVATLTNCLDTIVDNLGGREVETQKILHNVGQVHFEKSVNFTANNWLAFKTKFTESIIGELEKQSALEWNDKKLIEQLLAKIIQQIRKGFLTTAAVQFDSFMFLPEFGEIEMPQKLARKERAS